MLQTKSTTTRKEGITHVPVNQYKNQLVAYATTSGFSQETRSRLASSVQLFRVRHRQALLRGERELRSRGDNPMRFPTA